MLLHIVVLTCEKMYLKGRKKEKMSTEKIKEIHDKIYPLTKNDKARLAEKMMRDFDVDIYYCNICHYMYYGHGSCNITDHNEIDREINDPEKFGEIMTDFSEIGDTGNPAAIDNKAEIIEDILRDEFAKSVSYCEKCCKMSNDALCITPECPQDKIWSIYPM